MLYGEHSLKPLAREKSLVFSDGTRLQLPPGTNYIGYMETYKLVRVYVRGDAETQVYKLDKGLAGELEKKIEVLKG